MDLFMPEILFREGRPTQIFDMLSHIRPKTLPSLRPIVNILVSTKANVDDFDWVSLATWTARRSHKYEQTKDNILNHVQIIAHVACKSSSSNNIKIQMECMVQKLNALYI
jgi:hypothetical protein